MNRRKFLQDMACIGLSSLLPDHQAMATQNTKQKKVLVLGIDGLDYRLARRYMRSGLLPNLLRVAKKGGMAPLTSSMPPQSPVAWSNVCTGADSFVHGIYDFIHRNPKTKQPFLSTSRVTLPKRFIHLGDYQIPLKTGEVKLLRAGAPFWELLGQQDIPTTIFKMPANFPCQSDNVNMVSGMGTPDLRGGYGSYTLFTTNSSVLSGENSGGLIVPVNFSRGRMDACLPGPVNHFKSDQSETTIPLTVWRDPSNPVVRIKLGEEELLLKQAEWSDWLSLSFPMLAPFFSIQGICKLYLKSVHPDFHLYITPININPKDPSLPIASPEKYLKQLTEKVGFFYTQGLPDDTKALSEGILSEEEYLHHAWQVLSERQQLLDFELLRFRQLKTGMLFFYISSLDQNSHMYWRSIDKQSPLYNDELNTKYGRVILDFYKQIDLTIGHVLSQIDISEPNTTLIVMSDHGFASFNRQINLNTFLYQNGYLAMKTPLAATQDGFFDGVNWSRTAAYNLGINCIYLNKKNRENTGIVTSAQERTIIKMIIKELKAIIDPLKGQKAVSRVRVLSQAEKEKHPCAPDMIVGWRPGYRNSWKSILGHIEEEMIADNTDKWSGDHCIDPLFVPAVLITNKPIMTTEPTLCDLAPTILEQFGIEPLSAMTGKSFLLT